jgi:hypothetical protein
MPSMKTILVTAIIALVVIALVNKVPQLKSIVG